MLKIGLFAAMFLILTGCGQKEVEQCNSDTVKATIMNGTWEKERNSMLASWQNQFATFKKVPYMCSPVNYPSIRQEDVDRERETVLAERARIREVNLKHCAEREANWKLYQQKLAVHGVRLAPSLAPSCFADLGLPEMPAMRDINSERAAILKAHNQECEKEQAKQQEYHRHREAAFNQEQERIKKNIDLLNKVEAALVDVRQQKYEKENNVRYCAAEFEYQNLALSFRNDYACRHSITYKIEPLLDKPDSFYVSWICL